MPTNQVDERTPTNALRRYLNLQQRSSGLSYYHFDVYYLESLYSRLGDERVVLFLSNIIQHSSFVRTRHHNVFLQILCHGLSIGSSFICPGSPPEEYHDTLEETSVAIIIILILIVPCWYSLIVDSTTRLGRRWSDLYDSLK